jgi:protein SCO1/2
MKIALLLMIAAILAGCTNDKHQWHGKDITGVMPDLEFELINTNNKPVTAEDFAGQIRMMFFGFTSCPDICPATLAYLRKSINRMPEELQDRVTVLFVSVDPQRDTPERIEQYTDFFGDHIVGLVAEEKALRQLAKRYRTTFGYGKPDSDGHYDVSHSNAIYVFDEKGNIRLLLRSDLTTEEVAEDLTTLAASA